MRDRQLGPKGPEPRTRAAPARSAGLTRTDVKRRAITDAATRLFLQQGYQGTTMDDIATAAEVSKQTVYKQFQDKEQLFVSIVFGITDRVQQIVEIIEELVGEIVDVRDGLTLVARRYAEGVLSPPVVRLRRLVIAEADRFPELAEAYFQQAPKRGLDAIAGGLEDLATRQLLRIDDAPTAAVQFAYLVLGPLIDQALFYPKSDITDADIDACVTAGVTTFVAAHT